MSWEVHGEKLSKKLTNVVKGGHKRRLIVTDKDHKPMFHLPLLFVIIFILVLPLVAGVVIFLFLLSEYHAILDASESE